MIVTLLMSLIIMILNLIVSLIPNIDFDLDLISYIQPLANLAGYIDTFVSLDVILFSISLILIVDNYSLLFRVINWLWNKIPFLG